MKRQTRPEPGDQETRETLPVRALAGKAPELVCGVNQAFLTGYLHGLGSNKTTTAVLAPHPDSCCVELRGDETTGPRRRDPSVRDEPKS